MTDEQGNKTWTDTLINGRSIVGGALNFWDPDDLWQQLLGFNKDDLMPIFLEIIRSFFAAGDDGYRKKGGVADEIRRRFAESGFTDKAFLGKAMSKIGFEGTSPFEIVDGVVSEIPNLLNVFYGQVAQLSPFKNKNGEIVDYYNRAVKNEELKREFDKFDNRVELMINQRKADSVTTQE